MNIAINKSQQDKSSTVNRIHGTPMERAYNQTAIQSRERRLERDPIGYARGYGRRGTGTPPPDPLSILYMPVRNFDPIIPDFFHFSFLQFFHFFNFSSIKAFIQSLSIKGIKSFFNFLIQSSSVPHTPLQLIPFLHSLRFSSCPR